MFGVGLNQEERFLNKKLLKPIKVNLEKKPLIFKALVWTQR